MTSKEQGLMSTQLGAACINIKAAQNYLGDTDEDLSLELDNMVSRLKSIQARVVGIVFRKGLRTSILMDNFVCIACGKDLREGELIDQLSFQVRHVKCP
jgi:hypothetical protein